MQQFISGSYWWQEQKPTIIDEGWFDVDEKLPVNSIHAVSGDVWGCIHERHTGAKTIEKVHFDGSDWYDKDSRTCSVTHWKVIK